MAIRMAKAEAGEAMSFAADVQSSFMAVSALPMIATRNSIAAAPLWVAPYMAMRAITVANSLI